MKPLFLLLLFLAPCASAATLAELKADARQHSALLDRIERVETGGERDPAHAVGDRGKARGWLQCHPDYWADARAECPQLPAYAKGCADREASRLAACAYWRKYKAKTDKERALLHHYGPRKSDRFGGDKDGYTKKVGMK